MSSRTCCAILLIFHKMFIAKGSHLNKSHLSLNEIIEKVKIQKGEKLLCQSEKL